MSDDAFTASFTAPKWPKNELLQLQFQLSSLSLHSLSMLLSCLGLVTGRQLDLLLSRTIAEICTSKQKHMFRNTINTAMQRTSAVTYVYPSIWTDGAEYTHTHTQTRIIRSEHNSHNFFLLSFIFFWLLVLSPEGNSHDILDYNYITVKGVFYCRVFRWSSFSTILYWNATNDDFHDGLIWWLISLLITWLFGF